jgi:cytochrome c553
MRTVKIAAATVIALALIVVAISYGFLKSEGLSARRKPSKLEYVLANHALSISIPAAAKNAKNPMKADADALSEAGKDYSDHCAPCHARDGAGNTDIAKGLSPEVPDLRSAQIQNLSDGQLFYIIKNGVRFTGMPGSYFQNERIWRLVLLIRNFAITKNRGQ